MKEKKMETTNTQAISPVQHQYNVIEHKLIYT